MTRRHLLECTAKLMGCTAYFHHRGSVLFAPQGFVFVANGLPTLDVQTGRASKTLMYTRALACLKQGLRADGDTNG
jgi:hypothetical protein